MLRDLLRPAHFVPWSKPIDQLLREMQRKHLHMAFVVDEHGGIMGLCTLEDVLEQIVGEIGDEFDEEGSGGGGERGRHLHGPGARRPIAEFNGTAAADLPEDEGFETMGRVPQRARRRDPGEGRPATSGELGLHRRRRRSTEGDEGARRAGEAGVTRAAASRRAVDRPRARKVPQSDGPRASGRAAAPPVPDDP